MPYYEPELLSAKHSTDIGIASVESISSSDFDNANYLGDFDSDDETSLTTTGTTPVYFNRDTQNFKFYYGGGAWSNFNPLVNEYLNPPADLKPGYVWLGKNYGAPGSQKVDSYSEVLSYLRKIGSDSFNYKFGEDGTAGTVNPPTNLIFRILGMLPDDPDTLIVYLTWSHPVDGAPDSYEYKSDFEVNPNIRGQWISVDGTSTVGILYLTTTLGDTSIQIRAVKNGEYSNTLTVNEDGFQDAAQKDSDAIFVYYDSQGSTRNNINVKKVTSYNKSISAGITITKDQLDKEYLNRAVTFGGHPFNINDPIVKLADDNEVVIGSIVGYSNKRLQIHVNGENIKFINGTNYSIPIGSKIVGKKYNDKLGYVQQVGTIESNLEKSRGNIINSGEENKAGIALVKSIMKFGAW